MRSEDDLFKRNLFGSLRLVLASLVVFGHVWVVNHWLTGTWDPISRIKIQDLGTGQVAVVGFFSVSGFLISGSSRRNPAKGFVLLRAGRLLPGYWLMLVIVTVLFEPILFLLVHGSLAGLPIFGGESLMSYLFKNLFLLQLQSSIPGVVAHGMQTRVNGSAWSLEYEAFCYLVVATFVFLCRKFRITGWTWIASAVIALVMFLARLSMSLHILKYHAFTLAPLTVYFGAFFLCYTIGCFEVRWLTHPGVRIAAPVLLVALVSLNLWNVWGEFLFPICILTIGAYAGGRRSSEVGRRVDLSYGIYLFAWPIQQMLSAKHVLVNEPYLDFLLALLLVLPVAALSWFLIERPSLKAAHRKASSIRATSLLLTTST